MPPRDLRPEFRTRARQPGETRRAYGLLEEEGLGQGLGPVGIRACVPTLPPPDGVSESNRTYFGFVC